MFLETKECQSNSNPFLILAFAVFLISVVSGNVADAAKRRLSLSAQATLAAAPDIAVVTLGVVS